MKIDKENLNYQLYRQVRGDMTDVYKFISGKYDVNCSVQLQLHSCGGSLSGVESRGNLYKLVPDRSKYELRRHYFTHRIMFLHGIVCLTVLNLLSLSIVLNQD